jgi:hypothetical protein
VDQDSLEFRSGLIGDSGSGFRSRFFLIKTSKKTDVKKFNSFYENFLLMLYGESLRFDPEKTSSPSQRTFIISKP